MTEDSGPFDPSDWADARAMEIIAKRKMTTKILIDEGEAFGSITRDDSASLIAQALRDERERCARIAVNGCLEPPDGGSPTEAERQMCDAIAAAIRNLSD